MEDSEIWDGSSFPSLGSCSDPGAEQILSSLCSLLIIGMLRRNSQAHLLLHCIVWEASNMSCCTKWIYCGILLDCSWFLQWWRFCRERDSVKGSNLNILAVTRSPLYFPHGKFSKRGLVPCLLLKDLLEGCISANHYTTHSLRLHEELPYKWLRLHCKRELPLSTPQYKVESLSRTPISLHSIYSLVLRHALPTQQTSTRYEVYILDWAQIWSCRCCQTAFESPFSFRRVSRACSSSQAKCCKLTTVQSKKDFILPKQHAASSSSTFLCWTNKSA